MIVGASLTYVLHPVELPQPDVTLALSVHFEEVHLDVSRRHRRAPKARNRRCASNTCWHHWLYPVLDNPSQIQAQEALMAVLGVCVAVGVGLVVVLWLRCRSPRQLKQF